ncbi:MAG TPA: hypothetical protein VFS08_04840 [Gemmatimonadaceae bacterium]|nr:hypothetical protein [Gemmatimonadaceae bacterium]
MIFRGREPEAVVWRRFRSGLDGFTFEREDDHYAARIVTNAERALDLFHALSANFPPAVDVALEDRRSGRTYGVVAAALPDVRDAIARLKVPLSSYGGVELSVYTTEDQLTLTPVLELYAFSRTDRWLYVLLGKGLVEHARLDPPRSPADAPLAAAPELEAALATVVEQLGLQPA